MITTLVAVVGVLVPTIYKAWEEGKRASCQDNLKKLHTWVSMYTSAHDQYLMAYEDGWVKQTAKMANVSIAQDKAPEGAFSCPSQPFVKIGTEGPEANWRGTNYGINQHIASKLKDKHGNALPFWYQQRIRQFTDPSSKLLMADTSGSNFLGIPGRDPVVAGLSQNGQSSADALPPEPAQPFPYQRHLDGTANFLKVDGSVEALQRWPQMMLGPGTYGYRLWHAEHIYPGSGHEEASTDTKPASDAGSSE